MNIAQCLAGHFSNSGFDLPSNLDLCELCPKNTFQNKVGQTSCEKCPNGTTTTSTGSTSLVDCGGKHALSPIK